MSVLTILKQIGGNILWPSERIVLLQELYEPYRVDISKRDYADLWQKRTEIGLPNPKIVMSLSGDTESFSVQPWYSSAFREAVLQTIAEFGGERERSQMSLIWMCVAGFPFSKSNTMSETINNTWANQI